MKENFKIGLYNLLSKDKRISRFKEFHEIETKKILLFLVQIGPLKNEMTQNFQKMLCMNEKICIKKTYLSYIENNELEKIEKLDLKLDVIDEEIKEYEKLKKILQKYVNKNDTTENKEIVTAFKSLILYEKNIQKLYEEAAKDKEKILKIFKEIII